jgi:hypothetical protein
MQKTTYRFCPRAESLDQRALMAALVVSNGSINLSGQVYSHQFLTKRTPGDTIFNDPSTLLFAEMYTNDTSNNVASLRGQGLRLTVVPTTAGEANGQLINVTLIPSGGVGLLPKNWST